jgi:hypothetical protein
METFLDNLENNEDYSETANRYNKAKGDIVQQIKDFYMGKGKITLAKPEGLVPTKAALFGLDVRFRNVDKLIIEEKLRRSAFKTGRKNDKNGYSLNRHSYPEQAIGLKSKTAVSGGRVNKKNFVTQFNAGTCYDELIT